MIKRGMNNKGQEGFTWQGLGGLILVIIVVLLLILGLTGVLNPLFAWLKLSPGSGLGAIVKACDTYVQAGSKTDYCTFREANVDGRTEYVNCVDSRVQGDMQSANRGIYTCSADSEKQECIKLLQQGKSNPIVSGTNTDVACTNPSQGIMTPIKCVSDLKGYLLDTGSSCPPKDASGKVIPGHEDQSKPISGYNKIDVDEKVKTCCIAPIS